MSTQAFHSRLPVQYFLYLFSRAIRLRRYFLDLRIDFLVGHLNLFLIGNVIQKQRAFNVTDRLLVLILANLAPVDIEPLVAEVAAASDRNIDTFVLGLGTTENGPWMSRLARAGGTARPGCSDGGAPYCHYQVSDSADPNAALGEALTEIRTRSVSCEYQLPSPAYGSLLASDKASLVFQPGTGDAVRLSGLPPEANCPRPFALDAERRALELCETFCRRAANSVGSRVLLEFPCSSLP